MCSSPTSAATRARNRRTSSGATPRRPNVESEEIAALVQIARDARKRGWWQKYDDVLPDWFEVYVGLEAEASEIRTFQPQLIPGLLQTAEYAAAVIRAEHPDAPAAEIDRRVELRMRRQRDDDPPKMWVVLDEAALRRPIGGPATFKAQLQRLAESPSSPATPSRSCDSPPVSTARWAARSASWTSLSRPTRAWCTSKREPVASISKAKMSGSMAGCSTTS